MKKAHAVYGASKAERWLACPGSIRLSKDAPEQVESSYAEEGTRAHECLEYVLTHYGEPVKAINDALIKKKYAEEMIIHAFDAAERIVDAAPMGATLLFETKLDASHFTMKGQFGTADAIIADEFGRLTVIDYKYGAGLAVEVENNYQLIYYALAASKKFHHNFVDVELMVIQPRAHHEDGPIRSWVVPIEVLLEYEQVFRAGVVECEKPDAPLKAGDHCRWCPAKTMCPEISSRQIRHARDVFAPVSAKGRESIHAAPLETQLHAAELLDTWIKGVREAAFLTMKKGNILPGWKLVAKQARRKWADEDAAARELYAKLGPKVLETPRLKSPVQVEKVFKDEKARALLTKHVVNVSSGLTIASEEDRRPAVDPLKKVFFDNVTSTETEIGEENG